MAVRHLFNAGPANVDDATITSALYPLTSHHRGQPTTGDSWTARLYLKELVPVEELGSKTVTHDVYYCLFRWRQDL